MSDPTGSQPLRRESATGVLTLAMAVGFSVLFALSALGPFISRDLDIGRGEFGLLTSLLFVSAALSSLLLGGRVDRLSVRAAVRILFVVGALAWVLGALSRDYAWLVMAMIVGGVSTALSMPSTTRGVQQIAPAGQHGWRIGVVQSGTQVGSLVLGALLPSIALYTSWRFAFATLLPVAAVGLVWARHVPISSVRETRADGVTRSRTRRNALFVLGGYGFLMNFGVTTAVVYLPLFAFESLGSSEVVAGFLVSTVAVCSLAGKVYWGSRAGRSANVFHVMSGLALLAVLSTALLVAASLGRSGLVWLAAIALGLGGVSWGAVTMFAVLRHSHAERAGSGAGSVMFAGYLGAASGPFAFGSLVDAWDLYVGAWVLLGVVFLIASGLGMAARGFGARVGP